jgi:hypothetical protein
MRTSESPDLPSPLATYAHQQILEPLIVTQNVPMWPKGSEGLLVGAVCEGLQPSGSRVVFDEYQFGRVVACRLGLGEQLVKHGLG